MENTTDTIIDINQLADLAGIPREWALRAAPNDDPLLRELEDSHGTGGGADNAIRALLVAQHYRMVGKDSIADDCLTTAGEDLLGGGGPTSRREEKLVSRLLSNTLTDPDS